MEASNKNIWLQLVVPVLAAAAGGYAGVETSIAVLSSQFQDVRNQISELHSQDVLSISERKEFRERIARLEARQEANIAHLIIIDQRLEEHINDERRYRK